MTRASQNPDQAFLERLEHSTLFRIYRDAFQTATGLPLLLMPPDSAKACFPDRRPCPESATLCEILHICTNACQACIETNRRLLKEASAEGPSTCQCFAGLTTTAVAVRCGADIVGYLKTGQVFTRTPDKPAFSRFLRNMGCKGIERRVKGLLRKAYLETRVVDPRRYASIVVLLEYFATQLGQHLGALAIADAEGDPPPIAKARGYIREHLDEPIRLGELAHRCGLSESHFCRLFKKHTGLTLTDYVNHCRIERAKNELLKKEKRVSEVAFEVGYQSLSQFNRCFVRLNGHSPTDWRRRELAQAAGDDPGDR